jgi:hypothetical protein
MFKRKKRGEKTHPLRTGGLTQMVIVVDFSNEDNGAFGSAYTSTLGLEFITGIPGLNDGAKDSLP